jgi:hypothetical protein
LLSDGRILIAGGCGSKGLARKYALYDPPTASSQSYLQPFAPRHGCTLTARPDNQAILIGGRGKIDHDYEDDNGLAHNLSDCWLFDGNRNEWRQIASLCDARYGHTAVGLDSGDIFVVGCYGESDAMCERWDSLTQDWVRVASPVQSSASCDFAVVALANDSVALCKGSDPDRIGACSVWSRREGWRFIADFPDFRTDFTFTKPADHGVLLSGYSDYKKPVVGGFSSILNVTSGEWNQTADPATFRFGHQLVQLPSGDIVLVGGRRPYGDKSHLSLCVERFDLVTRAYAPLKVELPAITGFTVHALDEHRLLLVGGESFDSKTRKKQVFAEQIIDLRQDQESGPGVRIRRGQGVRA